MKWKAFGSTAIRAMENGRLYSICMVTVGGVKRFECWADHKVFEVASTPEAARDACQMNAKGMDEE